MEYNNFNKPSKRLLETSKRIDKQTDDYLKRYYAGLKEEEENIIKENYEKSMSAARFSAASAYARTKQRATAMNEAINYTNKTSVIGMTEMLSQIVEESLLFDTREYAKTNPYYKQEIRESIKDILENGNILQDIKNRDTLLIMEYVAKCIPDIKTGMSLTEDEISAYMTQEPAVAVEAAISRLSGNIKSRVANLVEKEQARVKKVKKEMPEVKDESLDTVPTDEVMDQDQDGQVDQLENPEENMAPEEMGAEEMPPEEEMAPEEADYEEAPVEEDPSMAAPAGAAPTKQISITPDGTVNVNIFESSFESILDEEIDCILEDGLLTEKFNDTKYIEKTANKEYTKSATRFGNITGFVFSGIIGALIGRFLGKIAAKGEHKEDIDMLEKVVRRDSQAMAIIDEIKDAYAVKDSGRVRSLKKDFTIRVKELKAEIKSKGTESFKESADRYVANQISKTRLFYKDVPRSGLIESLAVNAAQNMIAETGVYNRDIAFANALTYVTIIEAFAETGLLNVDRVAYNTITQQAGGKAAD